MDVILFWKLVHIISSTILFGTGIGSAFFMLWAHHFGSINARLFVSKATIIADSIFTLPTAIIQPISGIILASNIGYDLTEEWLLKTYIFYGIAMSCWIIVYFLQIKIYRLLTLCTAHKNQVPAEYKYYYYTWFTLGWPALIAFLWIFYIMVSHSLGY